MMCGGIRHELEIVGLVFVVRSNVQCHHSLEENLGSGMITEQGVPRDIVQLTCRRMGASLRRSDSRFRKDGGVKAENAVQPPLDFVSSTITYRCLQLYFPQRARFRCIGVASSRFLRGRRGRDGRFLCSVFSERGSGTFAQLLNEFQGKRATSAFVSVDGRSHEDEVWSKEVAHKRKWDSRSLVNNNEFSLSQDMCIFGLNVQSKRERDNAN